MSIEDLLRQMEQSRTTRQDRDYRPKWLRNFIRSVAEMFEPLEFEGRVGFDCQRGDDNWIVTMYIGTTEIIGGARDGQIDHVSFRVDLSRLTQLFRSIDRLEWYSLNNSDDGRFHDATRSLITLIGTVEEHQSVHLELLATPPANAGPGLQKHHSEITG